MSHPDLSNRAVQKSGYLGSEAVSSKPKHIAFSIKRIGDVGGGAEKVLAEVANGLLSRGYKITVICGDMSGTAPYYPLHSDIKIIYLNTGNVMGIAKAFAFLQGIAALRRAHTDCQPNVAISFMHTSYISAGLGLMGADIPLIASEHTGPEHYRKRPLQRLLLQITPLMARRITVVSEQIRVSFNSWLRSKMIVVPNPVNLQSEPCKFNQVKLINHPKILLSVGSLTPQKNQACLISAFALIADRFSDWTLRIAGEGPLRPELEFQVKDLGLSNRVSLPGNLTNIGQEYEQADLFVLPSSYESFGLATAEAIMYGLPAVGFADCPGTNTLIRPGENGVLVHGEDKVHALAESLAALMGDPHALQRLQNAPTEWLQAAYSLESVLDTWEQLIAACTDIKVHR